MHLFRVAHDEPDLLVHQAQVEPFFQSERKVFAPAVWCRQ